MKTSRLWIIAGSAALVAIVIGITAAILRPTAEPEASPTTPTPTASATPTPAPTVTPTAEPTPEASPTAAVVACDEIATAQFRASMQALGWTGRDTHEQEVGARPFDFPDGMLPGAVVCRWQEDPAAPTDNVTDLAWAPLPQEAQPDVIQTLGAQDYTLSPEVEGIFAVSPGGGAYLITVDDIRWAHTREELAYITRPAAAR